MHKIILTELRERIGSWNNKTLLGQIFVDHAPILKLYTEYVNSFELSMDTLAKYSKNKGFMAFVEQTRGSPSLLGLNSLLIQPVQRLPRYEMLLSDLCKNTWEGHPDMVPLRTALSKIKETADFVNESKRKSENRARLLMIQNLIGDKWDLFIPSRRFPVFPLHSACP